jgi:hypothetical protein
MVTRISSSSSSPPQPSPVALGNEHLRQLTQVSSFVAIQVAEMEQVRFEDGVPGGGERGFQQAPPPSIFEPGEEHWPYS